MPRSAGGRIDAYLQRLIDVKGTDLLLTAGAPPLARIDGRLVPFDDEKALRPEDTDSLVSELLTPEQLATLGRTKDVDLSFNWKGIARFRANTFIQRGSMAISLRLIPYELPTFAELGLPPSTESFVRLPHGLVLVTGPTGSGKSTTLAAMIDYINQHYQKHILTVEDPIEYVHRHKRSAVNQREIGTDAFTFERALRASLREDPDVLLVGEMRDLETIQIALTVAETGHLVFGTLHTNDTSQALDRIVDVFPAERQSQIRVQLASSLAGIVYQQLVPKIGGGRVAAFEVLMATHPIRNLIKEGKTRQIRNMITTGQKDGMQTLEMSLSDLVSSGVVTFEEAAARSLYPQEIKHHV